MTEDPSLFDLNDQVMEEIEQDKEEFEAQPTALQEQIRLRNEFWSKHDGSNH